MAKKTDSRRNGYNTNMLDRLRLNDEIRELLENWPEGVRPTLPKIEDFLGLSRDFLRNVISAENRERLRDITDGMRLPRGNWRMDPDYLAEFPKGEKRPYGRSIPSDEELRGILEEAIAIAGPNRCIHRDALAQMAGCNASSLMAALPEDARERLARHNRCVSESKRRGCAVSLRFFDEDFEQIEIQDIMKDDGKFGWIAARCTADSNALLKELLSFYAELPLELQQQEEDTAFDALLVSTARGGGRYLRKVALVVVDAEDGSWAVESARHSEISATADLLRAELVYLLRSGDELVHAVRKANSIPAEIDSERTDVTPG